MNKEMIKVIFPSKKINIFSISVLLIGFICGCIFLATLKETDCAIVTETIKNYIVNISNNNYNVGLAFKNNVIINGIYVIIMWLLGLSVIGILFHVLMLYIKGFITGFTISSIILTYKIKGTIFSLLYLILGEILNLSIILILGVYGISFTVFLINLIIKSKRIHYEKKREVKKYFTMLIILLIFTTISSSLETLVLPKILKLIIKWYV